MYVGGVCYTDTGISSIKENEENIMDPNRKHDDSDPMQYFHNGLCWI